MELRRGVLVFGGIAAELHTGLFYFTRATKGGPGGLSLGWVEEQVTVGVGTVQPLDRGAVAAANGSD